MTSAIFRNAESRNVIARGYEVLLQDTPQARPHCVPTRFGETHMLVAGPEHAPPLVMIHGALVNSAVAMREAHPLLERFRVYALDVIGQSVKSADVRLRWDGADYANWLLDVLDGLGLAKAHFCGASSGGVIARILAEHAPERIDRLVLLVPAGIVKPLARQVMMKVGIPMMLYRTMGSRKALARFLDSLLTSSDQRLEEYMGAALQHYKIDFSLPPFARVEALAGFRRPTLVIGASEDITVPGAALLQRARELFPQAALELIPDWKHTPPTDDVSRAKLCGLIASFLLAEDAAPSRAAG
jgi:2-hydroxy-6-oxonona-2,4-dienedioate hydrolase